MSPSPQGVTRPKPRSIDYQASPTLSDFHGDNVSFVRGMMGPLGSGKSVGMCMEVFTRALRQTPDKYGRRRSRWAIVRNTYGELKITTIKTWKEWIPEEIVPFVLNTPPITAANSDYKLEDGTTVDMEFIFLALDKPKDVKKLLSLELTGIWFNEAREIPKDAIDQGTGRVGRFPKPSDFTDEKVDEGADDGRATEFWSGIIMDTNPPDDDHWWYKVAEEEKPVDWRFWKQPPALLFDKEWKYEANVGQQDGIGAAENIANLKDGFGYYTKQLSAKTKEWINIYVRGMYGSQFDGKPVYKDVWNDAIHVSASPLEPLRGVPLILGWDWGLTPACVVCQMTPSGQFFVYQEYICKRGALRQFARETVIPGLFQDFQGIPVGGWGDPSGTALSQVDEATCFGELANIGLACEPAPTNDFVQRRGSVMEWLSRMVGGKPAFQLDPRCTVLRKGFNGAYRFSRIQVTGLERFRDVPDKNAYSHPHDALQYACSGAINPVQLAPVESAGVYVPQRGGGWGGYV